MTSPRPWGSRPAEKGTLAPSFFVARLRAVDERVLGSPKTCRRCRYTEMCSGSSFDIGHHFARSNANNVGRKPLGNVIEDRCGDQYLLEIADRLGKAATS